MSRSDHGHTLATNSALGPPGYVRRVTMRETLKRVAKARGEAPYTKLNNSRMRAVNCLVCAQFCAPS
jgi:hypothetical protein